MHQAFDIQNPPFDRLSFSEAEALRAKLDIGYWGPGQTIIPAGGSADHLHVIIKGTVEERDNGEPLALLQSKDTFDARALVQGVAGSSFIATEETLCYLIPKDVIQSLIKANSGFAAFFYSELSRKLSTYAAQQTEAAGSVNHALRARVSDTRLREAYYIDGTATISDAARLMEEKHTNTLFVQDKDRVGIVTGTNLLRAAVLMEFPLSKPLREVAHFEIHSVDQSEFLFEALIKMTRYRVRRLAVLSEGTYIGTLDDIDILGLMAGNSQLIPRRIDRARSVSDLEPAALDIQDQVERLHRQEVKVEVIAEITSDLNRALFSKLYSLLAPPSIKEAGCLLVMGSEGRGEQTVRTDQDNGLLLAHPVPEDDLAAFRRDFTEALERFKFPPCPGNIMVSNPQWSQTVSGFIQQIKGWVMSPDDMSAMNLGVFYDAVAVAGDAALLEKAKTTMRELLRGESAYLARFAGAIDQFEEASAGVLSSIMASVGVGSDLIHIKKSGVFPIVHGIRVMSIDKGVIATSTMDRIDALASQSVIGAEFAGDLKSALTYFLEIRLRSQLVSIRTGRREEEAIIRIKDLSSRERDLMREALKVTKKFREIVRSRYHLNAL